MKVQHGADIGHGTLGIACSMNCKRTPPPPTQMRLVYIHGRGDNQSARRKRHVEDETVSEPTSDGWCDGGGSDAGQHFAAQKRIDARLSPNDPFQRYSGRH